MIAFPMMLVAPANAAKMKVPEDVENYKSNDFPHFSVFEAMQLGQPMPSPSSPWTNALIIAGIPEDHIKLITPKQLLDLGFEAGLSRP